jgi:protein-L-isoaspartate(D-aspartate) O-methyltransferase
MAMNFDQARLNMVENQVRPWEVLDGRVLDVISRVHREDFVASAHRQLAWRSDDEACRGRPRSPVAGAAA